MAKAKVPMIEQLLDELLRSGATDLLVTAGAEPFARIDGSIERMAQFPPLAPGDTEAIALEMMTSAQQQHFATNKEVDFSFGWRGVSRLRVNAYRQRGAVSLAVRVIPYAIPSMDELGIPEVVQPLLSLPQGLILVTGSAGAGKSTTLASMIDWINEHRPVHIVTIEDPMEYVHDHKMAAVDQREIGQDSLSFDRALRAALREDPDVLLVGEMRDLESIQATLTIAETGHLVLATLHTNDTAQAIDRIIDVFPGDRQAQIRVQLATALEAVLYQQLLPRSGGGRIAAFEVLIATYAVRNLIKEGKTRQLANVIATSQRDGMQTFSAALERLVRDGYVPASAAARLGSGAAGRDEATGEVRLWK